MSDFKKYETHLKNSNLCKDMFLPTSLDKKNYLYSLHHKGKEKTLWYKSYWETLHKSKHENIITYTSKINPYHYLHKTILSLELPKLVVKQGYKIRWCDDLFINMIKDYKLVFNGLEIQYGNDKSLCFEFNCQNSWYTISENIGNKNNLTTFTEILESEVINISIPWFYTKDTSDAFPLHMCSEKDKLEHIINFNLQLKDLLIIENLEGKKIPFDEEIFISNNLTLNMPELEGLYTILTDQELQKANTNPLTNEIYSYSYIYLKKGDISLGETVEFNIDNDVNITDIFWGAVNLDHKNLYFGTHDKKSPIKDTTFLDIMNKTKSIKTDKIFLYHLLEKIPDKIGMNYWKNSILKLDDGRRFAPTINIKDSNFKINLINNSEDKTQFEVFVLLKYIQKFNFKLIGEELKLQIFK